VADRARVPIWTRRRHRFAQRVHLGWPGTNRLVPAAKFDSAESNSTPRAREVASIFESLSTFTTQLLLSLAHFAVWALPIKGVPMPNELTRLSPHIDEMLTSLTQTTDHERTLVQALSDELRRFDQEILRGIRTVSAEHVARRLGILNDLQVLANNIGEFNPQYRYPGRML